MRTEKIPQSDPIFEQDPVQMLIEDHRKVENFFRQFNEAGEKAFKEKKHLAEKICTELDIHAQLEEEIFYPALEEADDEKYREIVAEAREEHAVIKMLMEELKALDPEKDQEVFEAKMKVLMGNILHHAEGEEKHVLPDARGTLKDRADDIGEEMQHLKSKLTESID